MGQETVVMIRAAAGLLIFAIGCWCHAATTYAYDALGRVTQVVYGSGPTIIYAYDALGNRTSRAISGVPSISPISGTPQIANVNSAFDQPLKVKVTDSFGNASAGATVALTVPGAGTSANCAVFPVTDVSGVTQTTCTANGVAGSYVVSAAVAGIVGTATFSLTNFTGASGTTVQLTASSNPAFFATSITLTATITGNSPTGTVNFMVGGASIPGCSAQPVRSSVATCVTSTLTLGNNNVSAIYSGDGLNAAGSSSILSIVLIPERGLPDTGQDTCYDDAGNADAVPASDPASIARDTGSHPRQDCRYGRDAAAAAGALTKIGAGPKGRDYSKIANNGSVLAANAPLGSGATDWACTIDNTTGLIWEVKTTIATDLRYNLHAYTWRSTDASTHGGDPGAVGTNTCGATLPSGQCNTQAFVMAVNAAQLCRFSDWRLPSHRELLTLVYLDGSIPTIASDYFPNTLADPFWTSTTYSRFPDSAWNVDFLSHYLNNSKTIAYRVRLVRGDPF